MKQRIFCCVLAICLISGIFTACAPKTTKYSSYSMDYFDTVTTITGYAKSQEEFDAVVNDVLSQLKEYHLLYNIYLRYENLENLCTINELVDGAHRTVTVDRKIIDLLLYAKEMHDLTGGMTNVAMGSVLSLWHDHRTVGKDDPAIASLPPLERLQAAAEHTDLSSLLIDEAACSVTLTDPEMTLDVGAIAKGYATERIAQSLEKKGITGYVLNVGGNVRTIGLKPDGSAWTVGIENPDGGDYLAYLQLSGQSLVTSGSYQRFYYVDGKRYHHIIHPDTLMPAEGYVSVSVICSDSGLADALSTALFCLPLDEGQSLVNGIDGAEAMWLSQDGSITTSPGWENFLKK